MISRFTSKSQQVLQNAKKSAEGMGHTYIGTEHLLLGILGCECVGAKILEDKKIEYTQVYDKLVEISGVGSFSNLSSNELTPKCKKIIEKASLCAKRTGSRLIGTEHILYAICEDGESVGARILSSCGINLQVLKNEIATFLDNNPDATKSSKQEIPGSPTLSQYAKNLNTLAENGLCDPVICRDLELERLIQILCRRTKNNPCLIGEPGVGKTAIVEGLAARIVSGQVPLVLSDKIVVSLDLSSMIAGAKYRGEFEERMKNILSEIKSSQNLILFIDEIHTIIGAGSAEGAVDAANIIKPALARANIQLIGATTIKEYRKYIEKDPALERRFQPIIIEEPDIEASYKILFGLRERYEEHHGVKITDDAIYSAVDLSKRYINDRFLPDKAIDLIDEACSLVRINHFSGSSDQKRLETKIKDLARLKEQAILDEDFELASKIRDEEISSKIDLNKLKSKASRSSKGPQSLVTKEHIEKIVTRWTSVPVSSFNKDKSQNLLNLESLLSEAVVGQEEAIKAVSASIKRGQVGLKNPLRPIGSFLFLGPTGVGKTELAKSIAKVVFGSSDSLIRIDMSEYMEKHSVSRLIGAPPGYVGYDEGGLLTEAVRRHPYSLILFDELEKAHRDVYNILLQILEDGSLTDSQGRNVSFKNTILIMTSNIGAKDVQSSLHFGFDSHSANDTKKDFSLALKRELSPELLNRLDDIIVFNSLTESDIEKIAHIMLKEIGSMASQIGISLEFDKSAYSLIAKQGYSKEYGARQLRRLITNTLENQLCEKIISGEIKSGDKALVFSKDGKIEFSKI